MISYSVDTKCVSTNNGKSEQAICSSSFLTYFLVISGFVRYICRTMNRVAADKPAEVIAALVEGTNHGSAVALYFMQFNFRRVHQTLRVIPVRGAGIADHVWALKRLWLYWIRIMQRKQPSGAPKRCTIPSVALAEHDIVETLVNAATPHFGE